MPKFLDVVSTGASSAGNRNISVPDVLNFISVTHTGNIKVVELILWVTVFYF